MLSMDLKYIWNIHLDPYYAIIKDVIKMDTYSNIIIEREEAHPTF